MDICLPGICAFLIFTAAQRQWRMSPVSIPVSLYAPKCIYIQLHNCCFGQLHTIYDPVFCDKKVSLCVYLLERKWRGRKRETVFQYNFPWQQCSWSSAARCSHASLVEVCLACSKTSHLIIITETLSTKVFNLWSCASWSEPHLMNGLDGEAFQTPVWLLWSLQPEMWGDSLSWKISAL